MTPYFEDGPVMVFYGHVLDVLRQMPDESVNCVVTSPPYWGLRDYKLPPSVWGGDPLCQHDWEDASWKPERWGSCDDDKPSEKQQTNTGSLGHRGDIKKQSICAKCGAWLGCLGLEPTPQLFIKHCVMIFAEVRRVLRSDGTCWVNLGDCYATGAGKVGDCPGGGERGAKWAGQHPGRMKNNGLDTRAGAAIGPMTQPNRMPQEGLKPKDLVGIPWRFAFALQADGWWLRQDIIWSKPNPMPESVTDRCTKAHEYMFLLTKSARYYFNQEAIKEPAADSSLSRWDQDIENQHGSERVPGKTNGAMKAVGGRAAGNKTHKTVREYENSESEEHRTAAGLLKIADKAYPLRNKRSVWTVATEPFSEAHFATFPQKLIEPCILAGCPPGGVVLDPFAGSLTTMQVATKLNCKSIGIELNSSYIDIGIRCRLRQSVLDFTQEPQP